MENNFKGVSGITFTAEDLKQYPLLMQLKEGQRVLAIASSDYGQLLGDIIEIRYGNDKETENECIVEIIVDFDEPDAYLRTTKYAVLNGTSVEEVIMDEAEIAVCINGTDYQLLTGQLVCEWCANPIIRATETQQCYISWTWDPDKNEYIKEDEGGDTNHKRCSQCDSRLEAENILIY